MGLQLCFIIVGVWRAALETLEAPTEEGQYFLLSISLHNCPLCLQGWTVQLMVSRTGLNVPEFRDTRSDFDPFRWLDSASGSLR